MGEGTKFRRVYGESDPAIVAAADGVRRVVYCSGKVYYDLLEERDRRGAKDVALVRIEQLAPFPWDKVAAQAALYKNAVPVWCQEEPKNMGAWSFVQPRFATATRTINGVEQRPSYVGRRPAAATATGLGARAHNAEQEGLVKAALD
jgi:2-oxoglutarate dehydrogenase E1 component